MKRGKSKLPVIGQEQELQALKSKQPPQPQEPQQPPQPQEPQQPQKAQKPQERAQDVGKSKLMAQQLGLLLHAQNCLKEEKERKLRHLTTPHLVYKGL